MINLKNAYARERMAHAGRLLAELFVQLGTWMEPGMSTLKIDAYIEEYLNKKKLKSATKGYMGKYHHSSCISVNAEVVHGVPRADMKIALGDLVKIDVCASYDGYCADMARSFFLGDVSQDKKNFVAVAQEALDKGIQKAISGGRISDISAAVQAEVEAHGYGVVREFAGHGIGKKMHEDPEILNYGKPGQERLSNLEWLLLLNR